jgi:hypothetical protein
MYEEDIFFFLTIQKKTAEEHSSTNRCDICLSQGNVLFDRITNEDTGYESWKVLGISLLRLLTELRHSYSQVVLCNRGLT